VTFEQQPTLVGELVELRPIRDDDYDALFAISSDPLLWEQHPSKERSTADGFRAWFTDAVACEALVAIDRSDGRILGTSRYHDYDAERSDVEIGWTFLARSHWGTAYNGEMKQLMIAHAFRFVDSVYFEVHSENFRSQKAVQKLGAVYERSQPDKQGRGTNHIYRLVKPASP
jgi:N-acetyltransferase